MRSLLAALCLIVPIGASAHRLDECLQATLIALSPDEIRLHVNLTPGVAVAPRVLGRVDGNGDGLISSPEADAYLNALRRDLSLRLDGRNLELGKGRSQFPTAAELQAGEGVMELEFVAGTGRLGAGKHRLTLENRHCPETSVYLCNAALPASPLIEVTRQIRNDNQSQGEIEFTYRPPAAATVKVGLVLFGVGLGWLAWRFEHRQSRNRMK